MELFVRQGTVDASSFKGLEIADWTNSFLLSHCS